MAIVSFEVTGGVAVLRLDDVAHRNAMSYEMARQLAAAVRSIQDDERVGALILTAAPPVFSAGGSIDDLEHPPGPLADVYAGFEALAACEFPTIAIVAGPAIGAGVNLALACDVILASPDAVFDPRFLDLGIHPGGGHLWNLRQRIGRQGTAAMVLLGDTLTGTEAEARGLVWRCLPEPELLPLAMRLAERAVDRPSAVVRRTKATLNESAAVTSVAAAAELERGPQEWSMQQPEFAEGLLRLRQRIERGKR